MLTRCEECKSWSNSEMEDYVRHRRSLESKAKKPKTSVDTPTTTSTVTSTSSTPTQSPKPVTTTESRIDSESVRLLESRLHADMRDMLNEFFHRHNSGQGQVHVSNNNISFAAPPSVPDMCPGQGDAGGNAGPCAIPEGRPCDTPGAVQLGNQDPPPPTSGY